MITNEELAEIATRHATAPYNEFYLCKDFVPHNWVVFAMAEAFEKGRDSCALEAVETLRG